MELIKKAIANVFIDADVNQIDADTKLSSIPGWDSMNAVNLLLELQTLTGCGTLKFDFRNEMTVAQLSQTLKEHGIKA